MIRQRQFLIRRRSHLALLAVFGALTLAVAAEHSGAFHVDESGHGGLPVVSMCLAVMTVVSTTAPFLAGFLRAAHRVRPVRVLAPVASLEGGEPLLRPPRERAGPRLLQVVRR